MTKTKGTCSICGKTTYKQIDLHGSDCVACKLGATVPKENPRLDFAGRLNKLYYAASKVAALNMKNLDKHPYMSLLLDVETFYNVRDPYAGFDVTIRGEPTYKGMKIVINKVAQLIAPNSDIHVEPFCLSIRVIKDNGRTVYFDDPATDECFL